jgi:hypothetical protein
LFNFSLETDLSPTITSGFWVSIEEAIIIFVFLWKIRRRTKIC